ncbi:hypothetical protein NJLHNGOC_06945 [Novacetimonas cocois]|uniref:Uncharacterized protein n=1 Tax=Novacetimonas cocois TaxID=1747507 RepID=A0A365YXA9_9PROT|nr:hypothetical protein NJLHNGOC_06945 [Novacetimonas cocois]
MAGLPGNVSCGYLISSYGPETGGPGASFAQIGDISLGTDTRLSYRGVASNAAYYTGALLYDVQVVQTNLTSEQTTRANADAALQANFANYLPLSANGKNVTYGNGGGYRVALQTDGNFVIYDAATPIFGVGGPTGTVSLGLPVAGSVRSGTVSGGVYTVINDVMELTFSVSDVADQSTIEFPMAFSQTPNVFFQPSLEANGDNLSCSLISATATGCTVQIHNNANGSSTSAPTLVVRASGTI